MRNKIQKALIVFSLLALTSIHANAQKSNFYIYICFGQSNMEGMGTIEAQDQTVNSRFRVLEALDCPNLDRQKGKWYTAVPPTCQCYSKL